MDTMINLIVKVQQFEDKRIEAKASWNIKELKGKLSEIYPTSTEEQKLIYSGKLLNDTVVLKDVLREYEGQEAHTVHLVFTPKTSSRLQSKLKESTQTNSSTTNQSSSSDMSTSELRQRHTAANATTANTTQEQTQQSNTNIPSNYYNAFYGNNMPFDANNLLAQQYAMQAWMQQAYAQYMNQYMNLVQQQQLPAQQASGFPFMQPQMPFIPPTITPTSSAPSTSTVQSPNPETQASPAPQEPQQPQVEPPAAEPQRRFPNIIQDEQENRDWLDIIYSMSRLLILLCLVYFYSSPLRCIIVILIGLSIYLYHIYRQNQNRLNNNNTTRVNLNVNRPPQPQVAAARPENAERTENSESPENNQQQDGQTENSETEPLVNATDDSQSTEPQVSWLTIARTFVVSFVASIIPDHPAM